MKPASVAYVAPIASPAGAPASAAAADSAASSGWPAGVSNGGISIVMATSTPPPRGSIGAAASTRCEVGQARSRRPRRAASAGRSGSGSRAPRDTSRPPSMVPTPVRGGISSGCVRSCSSRSRATTRRTTCGAGVDRVHAQIGVAGVGRDARDGHVQVAVAARRADGPQLGRLADHRPVAVQAVGDRGARAAARRPPRRSRASGATAPAAPARPAHRPRTPPSRTPAPAFMSARRGRTGARRRSPRPTGRASSRRRPAPRRSGRSAPGRAAAEPIDAITFGRPGAASTSCASTPRARSQPAAASATARSSPVTLGVATSSRRSSVSSSGSIRSAITRGNGLRQVDDQRDERGSRRCSRS